MKKEKLKLKKYRLTLSAMPGVKADKIETVNIKAGEVVSMNSGMMLVFRDENGDAFYVLPTRRLLKLERV